MNATATAGARRSALTAEAVRSMTAARSHVDRVRARATSAAAAGVGLALLVAGSVATVQDTVFTGTSRGTDAAGRQFVEDTYEAAGGLAPFLAQPGLRPGFVVAAVLLVLPFLALAVQALRVGQVVEDRRARQLLVAGATSADLRRLRTARTTAAFLRGGLAAGPLYVLLWLVLGAAPPAGYRMLPPLHWAMPLIWAAVTVVLWALARVLGTTAFRRQDVLVWQRTGAVPRVPSRLFVLLSAVAGGVLLLTAPAVAGRGGGDVVFPVTLVVAVVLFVLAAGAGVARSSAGVFRTADAPVPTPDRRSRSVRTRGDAAVGLLAEAQRRGNTGAVTGTAGVLFLCGLSFGVESTFAAGVLAEANHTAEDLRFYVGGAALAGAVGLLGAAVAIAALVLSLTDHLLGNRRAVASTAALGVPVSRLVRVQAVSLVRTAVPVTAIGVLVSALPYSVTALGRPAEGTAAWWTALLPLAVAVVVTAATTAACFALARLLSGRVRAAAALENLRVP
ncbi:hypothetical protein [Kineococcus rhizosphaerae]|uniref:FtsX-like permease family protein n=1 Tax=Kineococcus rhizosphaerae TaxID=559628 RepID=A0A2T0R650_9ACTN|nr:hypothetical protein [Kineococcus rhizosphaerae]PRY16633.1 hypothetical protein CLV37_10364 [Kineococcus rhizosphaerae]